MPSASHPCLPQDLVDKLNSEFTDEPLLSKSRIYEPHFEDVRLNVVKFTSDRSFLDFELVRAPPQFSMPASAGIVGRLWNHINCFRSGDGKNLLQSAILDLDVLAAYEVLRLGISLDAKDTEGVTSLFFALECILNMSQLSRAASTPVFRVPLRLRPTAADYERQVERLERIAVLIIEQHADVNSGAFGFTPLTIAVMTGRWRIELLLRHGALPTSPETMEDCSPTNKARFAALVASTQAANPRPPRPCPCWSGKQLSECHTIRQPYPEYFLCCCGKRKTYATCCAKRGLVMTEKWDEDSATIIISQLLTKPSRGIIPEIQRAYDAGWKIALEVCATADPKRVQEIMISTPQARREFLSHTLDQLGRKDDVDPAFWQTLNVVNFLPRPWVTLISALEGQTRMDEWNAAVDSYIHTSLDMRPNFEIEMKAKIDSRGGPLHKYCEAEECTNVEGRDVDKMKCCSGCKLIVYCSRECQSKDWKRHKKDCGLKTHQIQLLPSQRILEQLMFSLQAFIAHITLAKRDNPSLEETIERLSIQAVSTLGHCDFLPAF